MKKKTSTMITAILAVVIVVCIVFIAKHVITQKNNGKVYEDMQTEVVKQEPTEVTSETTQEEKTIDFNALWETNPDIYAWIEIPGTDIAYPVLQKEGNDDYYLDVTVEGNSGLPGAIYSQASRNSKDFTDFNTILYGHDMKDGSIFGELKNYRDADFWADHSTINIYTPDQKLTYRIFAGIVYSDVLIPETFDLNSTEGRQEFLDSLYDNTDSRSLVDKDIPVTTDSKLLTLSTCIGNESNHRYLIVGVLENQ